LLRRWVYQQFFVADGNFKADHVQQKRKFEVWLSEGGGMMAKNNEYESFLWTAVECSMVSGFPSHSTPYLASGRQGVVSIAQHQIAAEHCLALGCCHCAMVQREELKLNCCFNRRLHANENLEPLSWRC
jgi:hypothetical protein